MINREAKKKALGKLEIVSIAQVLDPSRGDFVRRFVKYQKMKARVRIGKFKTKLLGELFRVLSVLSVATDINRNSLKYSRASSSSYRMVMKLRKRESFRSPKAIKIFD